MKKNLLVFQFAVGLLVAYVTIKNTPLKAALIGDATGIPEWINLKNPGIRFK